MRTDTQNNQGLEENRQLSDYELDQLIKEFDPTLPTSRDWTRRQTSWSGAPMDMNRFSEVTGPYVPPESCEIAEQVYKVGGVRLLTLYCNNCNLASAAVDLNIKYGAMVKWFQRWKKRALASGLKPSDLGLSAVLDV